MTCTKDMTTEEKRQFAERMISVFESKNTGLVNRYGTGVRPSWLSAEIAMNDHQADYYRKIIQNIDAGVEV
mgnify:CR=1 FL=1|jgi:hypothetical protein